MTTDASPQIDTDKLMAFVFRAVDDLVRRAAKEGALPVMVAYNLPHRDAAAAAEGVCHSCGGVSSEEAYRRWISHFYAGIGEHRARNRTSGNRHHLVQHAGRRFDDRDFRTGRRSREESERLLSVSL